MHPRIRSRPGTGLWGAGWGRALQLHAPIRDAAAPVRDSVPAATAGRSRARRAATRPAAPAPPLRRPLHASCLRSRGRLRRRLPPRSHQQLEPNAPSGVSSERRHGDGDDGDDDRIRCEWPTVLAQSDSGGTIVRGGRVVNIIIKLAPEHSFIHSYIHTRTQSYRCWFNSGTEVDDDVIIITTTITIILLYTRLLFVLYCIGFEFVENLFFSIRCDVEFFHLFLYMYIYIFYVYYCNLFVCLFVCIFSNFVENKWMKSVC